MENYLTLYGKRFAVFLNCLFWLLLSNNLNAQDALTITWDSESGCQIYKEDERKEFLEEIGEGLCVRVCENTPVNYSLSNTNGWPATWTITGGAIQGTPSNTSCQVQWGEAGWGNVAVTVETPDGPQTREVCIEIIDGPLARFYVEPYDPRERSIHVCLEETLYFTNLSNANGGSELVSYLWHFENPGYADDYSPEWEPAYTFNYPGTYKVTLTVTNQCNCTSTYSMEVNVDRQVGFDITCNSVVCEGGTDTYTIPREIAERCAEHGAGGWSVQGGTIISPLPHGDTIEVLWDNVDDSGFGYVTFDARECGIRCALTTIKVPVVKNKGTIIGETVVCSEEYIRYKLPQWPTTDFVWTLDDIDGTNSVLINTDQRNEVIIFTQHMGTVILRCTYQNTLLNCGGTAELKINIRPLQLITGPEALCEGDPGQYIVGGYDANWTLTNPDNTTVPFSGGVFNHTFTVPGKYTLTAEGQDFCSQHVPFSIRVDAIPPAPVLDSIVGPRKVCTAAPVEYSIENDVPGTVMVWEPINGTLSGSAYGEAVTVEFTPGFSPYGIKVWRENTADPHCVGPATILYVTEFEVDIEISGPTEDICASSITDYDAVIDGTPTIYTEGEIYEWSIYPPEAGSVMSGQNTPEISVQWNQYVASGSEVRLTVRKCGQPYPAALPINVMGIPDVEIVNVPTETCPDNAVFPQLNATGAPLTGGTVYWDYGDGSNIVITDHDDIPGWHFYNNPGNNGNTTYTITATVTSPNGCLTPIIATWNVTVKPAPVAAITPAANVVYCNTLTPFYLNATLQYGYNPSTTIQWYDGIVPIPGDPMDPFKLLVTGEGNYYAYVENDNGCGTYTNGVLVTENCGGCNVPATVTMDAQQDSCNVISATASATPGGVYGWSAGPLANQVGPLTDTSASYSYRVAGDHTIIYTATYMDGSGNLCTILRYDTVTLPFITDVKYNATCNSAFPGVYEVNILDNSNYHPDHDPDTMTFLVDSSTYSEPIYTPYKTVYLAPGTYTIGVRLTKAGYSDCESTLTIVLPAIPSATIVQGGDTCHGTALQLGPGGPVDPALSYMWDFGDGSFNSQPNTFKVYGTPGIKTIKLRVQNSLGCYSEDEIDVEIFPNLLNGTLTSDSPNCEEDPIVLTFTNTGSTPSSYTWMNGENFVATTAVPTYQVTESGSYWVTVNNAIGCYKHLDAIPAKFIMTPDAVITGPNGACVGESFTLSAYAGQGMEYNWYYNGSPYTGWTSSATLDFTLPYAGPHTFQVKVRTVGSTCEGTSDVFDIEAYDTPPAPAIWFDFVQCEDPYTFKLHADAGQPGTYTWSDGQDGMDINVNTGGPYMVTFTNLGGCTSTAQIDVPKDPESYFWIFPKGCYDFCNKIRNTGPFMIIGPSPSVSFDHWSWLYNGSVMAQGWNTSVDDYSPMYSGTYNMTLSNGYCDKTTEPMELTIEECDCEVKWEIREIKQEDRPFCHYTVVISIDNPTGDPMYANIFAPNGTGIFTPGNVTVPPGGGTFVFQFTPINFFGGPLQISIRATNPKGEQCRGTQEIDFPNCWMQEARTPMDDAYGENGLANRLVVAPNPANGSTGLTYTFANPAAQNRTIEIYSLLGVLLDTHTPEENEGSWTLNLQRYPAGQYIAVMREDGSVVAQQAIIVE